MKSACQSTSKELLSSTLLSPTDTTMCWPRYHHAVGYRYSTAPVLSRLDYCNAVLAGLQSTLATLERVQNVTTYLVLSLRPHDHISQALRQLHWQPIEFHIEFSCLPVHIILH